MEIGGWLQFDGPDEQRLGGGCLSGLKRQRTQRVQRVRMPRHRRDHLTVDRFGFRQPASHVKLLTLAEKGVDLLRSFAHTGGSSAG
jgi:hypothetical protein